MTGEFFCEQAPRSQPLAAVPGDRHLVDEPSDATTDGSANCEIIPDRVTDCRQRRQWLQVKESNPERVVGLCQRIHGRRPAQVVEVDHRSHCLALSLGQLTHVPRRAAHPVLPSGKRHELQRTSVRHRDQRFRQQWQKGQRAPTVWILGFLRCVIQRGTDYDCAFFGTGQETNQGGGFLFRTLRSFSAYRDCRPGWQTHRQPRRQRIYRAAVCRLAPDSSGSSPELSHRSPVRAAYD